MRPRKGRQGKERWAEPIVNCGSFYTVVLITLTGFIQDYSMSKAHTTQTSVDGAAMSVEKGLLEDSLR